METNVSTYEGDEVTVTWDRARCIHAEACVHGLSSVFDPERRSWIEPDQAHPDAVEAVTLRCPTGALHLTRGGTDPETPSDQNRIAVEPDGPLYVHGDVTVVDADGETLLTDTRVALCRCGRTGNAPLCDGSHDDGFTHDGTLVADRLSGDTTDGGPLRIRVAEGGPLLLEGPVTIEGAGDETASGRQGALCRCGASASKPFCDGSHSAVGFDAE